MTACPCVRARRTSRAPRGSCRLRRGGVAGGGRGVAVLLCAGSREDVETAAARGERGERVAMVAPLDGEAREVEGAGGGAGGVCARAAAARVPLVGLPVHQGGPARDELLRDALAVLATRYGEGGVLRRGTEVEVGGSLGATVEQWAKAVDTLRCTGLL